MISSEQLLSDLRQLHPSLIDLSLGRIERLLGALGNPQDKLPPVVHVAGTNGKGSVLAILKAILEASGNRVHTFTSPHLVRFHERIHLANGEGSSTEISEDVLVDVLSRTEAANDGAPITFFEITTAAAYLAYSEFAADILLLETGLGGRLDATNVVDQPAATIIMPVSSDHTQFLGETIGEIAWEKAGILKPGVPCIVARQPDEALRSIEKRAREIDAPLIKFGSEWDAFEQHGRLLYQAEDQFFDLPLPALNGPHQVENAGAAIAAALTLEDFNISEASLERGLQTVKWPARLERLTQGALNSLVGDENELWLDGGHNAAAGEILARALADMEERSPKPLFLITGMLQTKDAGAFFDAFKGLAHKVITVPVPDTKKSFSASELAAIATRAGLNAQATDGLDAALAACHSDGTGTRRIMICGSLYLAGHVLARHRGISKT